MTDTTKAPAQNAALARRMFGLEVDGERANLDRALRSVAGLLSEVQNSAASGRPPTAELDRLIHQANQALRHAAAWGAMDRVGFMLPGEDGKD